MLRIDYEVASIKSNSKHKNRETSCETITIIQMRAGGGPGKDQSSGGGELSSDSEYTWKFKVTVFSDR